MQNLKEYFESRRGHGILSTADESGRVNSALYARPHVLEDDSVAFIMRRHRSYDNVCQNPHASYLFLEQTGNDKTLGGIRLYLTKTGEDDDPAHVGELRRRHPGETNDEAVIVTFAIDETRPLLDK